MKMNDDLKDLYEQYLNGALSEDKLTDEERDLISGMLKTEITTLEAEIKELERQWDGLPEEIDREEVFDCEECGSPATDYEMKSEALKRLEFWINKIGLNTNVYTYFENDRLYYSYLTAGGFIGSIDTISYDAKYESKVKSFEKEYDVLVYHCVESQSPFGKLFVMLYVGRDKDEWAVETPMSDGLVMANVYNLDEDFNEIGDVKFGAFQGALVQKV